MRLIEIKDGCVIIRLTPPQCASLAKACQFAGLNTLSDDIDHWRTFAAMFYACAVASYGQGNTCPKDAQAIEQNIESSGLNSDEVEEIDMLNPNGKL